MASVVDTRRFALGNQLDIDQILLEAQNRWLRPAEICEILRNYRKFRICPEPANMPPSGSLFLFDRKVLRYFRKDGHNWRKKKDGKTVKEAHERLKAGSIDVLHCYYAHGEDNENFQRRSYWMLEEYAQGLQIFVNCQELLDYFDFQNKHLESNKICILDLRVWELSHIVLVHYREVKGNRTNSNRIKETEGALINSQETEEVPNSELESSMSSNFPLNSYQMHSQTTDTTSLNSAQASEYEDAESAYNHQASSRLHSFLEPVMEKVDAGLSAPYYPAPFPNDFPGKLDFPGVDFSSLAQESRGKESSNVILLTELAKNLDFPWDDVLDNCAAGVQSVPSQTLFSSTRVDTFGIIPKQENEILMPVLTDSISREQEFGSNLQGQEEGQTSGGYSAHLSIWSMDQKFHSDSAFGLSTRFGLQEANCVDSLNSLEPGHAYSDGHKDHPLQNDFQIQPLNVEHGFYQKSDSERNLMTEGKANYSALKQPSLLDGSLTEEGLKKVDSFNRWMSKELGDVNESHMQSRLSSSASYWDTVESENGVDESSISPQGHLDTYMLSPSLSHDQLFSIIDFSPNWAYAGLEVKVLIMGKFLKGQQQDAEQCKWSCMFGEVEVPAEVISDGVLRCHTPIHKAGRVPFYVTCSNRLACSEVREFEYRVSHIRDVDNVDMSSGSTSEILLRMRFVKLLSLAPFPNSGLSNEGDIIPLSSKINSLMEGENDEWEQMLWLSSEDSPEKAKEQLLQKLLKEKLHGWLLQKAAEGGKGPSVLDEDGQGVLHFAAALSYDWAIPLTTAAGVSVNFRDANGWTALHWAAFCGRERTVAFLISQGAAPGALTDPTPKYLAGQTPADLASSNGHKGIAGYLAESALSAHLESLKLKESKEADATNISGIKAVQTVSERSPTQISVGDLPLKDSLAAVCNATQAAARIHQVFRVQSFQKKQLQEFDDGKFAMSDEQALSLLAVKTSRLGQHDEPVHAAAIRIQNKFRSWKGRKDFLIIRQRIVKIQAHVRGHQVRKNYRKIIWSVGILEKVILRWRRKGSGLRGFKLEAHSERTSMLAISTKEDDYDFLKEGRKQTEERLQKALARVKSMVQYPEARDQYRRLLNVVSEIQESKVAYERGLNSSEETSDFDDLIDIEALLDDDTFMTTAS